MFFMILASYTLFLVHVKKNWNLTLLRVNLTGWVDYPPPSRWNTGNERPVGNIELPILNLKYMLVIMTIR